MWKKMQKIMIKIMITCKAWEIGLERKAIKMQRTKNLKRKLKKLNET